MQGSRSWMGLAGLAAGAFVAAGFLLVRLDVRRAEEGIDPTVLDVVDLEDGTRLVGQVIEKGGDSVRYRLREVEIPRDLVAGEPREAAGSRAGRESLVRLTSGEEWTGQMVESGTERLTLRVTDRIIDLPAERVARIRRVHESEVEVALANESGALRPILIDYLWMQADRYMREGRWYELRAIYAQISQLQPYNETVWHFNSWNMAYNIAVKHKSPEDSWPWVQEGIELLLQGIRENPESWSLQSYMGFMLKHKCGREPYYQAKALEIFGTGRRHYLELAADWFERTRAIPGHHSVSCSVLLLKCYQTLMAEMLLDGNVGLFEEFRRRAGAVFEHVVRDHPEDLDDKTIRPDDTGAMLLEAGHDAWMKTAESTRDDFERARRFFELAERTYGADSARLLDESARRAALEMRDVSRALAKMSDYVGEGIQLAAESRPEEARARYLAALRVAEIELLSYSIPYTRAVSPDGTLCQAFPPKEPVHLKMLHQYVRGDLLGR